ncbi:MAG: sodium-dependent transporter [Bacteroidota bacterium]
MASRGGFSNRLGFIAAAAGSAVGLGNIWKFPYEVGENGGAAFLVIYLACAFLICLPIMLAETAIGRNTRLNPFGAFNKIGNRKWGLVGLLGVLSGIMILSFYNVVAGWAFGYFIQIGFGGLLSKGVNYAEYFGGFVSDITDNLLFSIGFMVLTALIVAGGVQKGIERWTKILMPLLITMILGLISYGLTLDGAMDGLSFYLVPDFGEINANTFYTALAQAFFSLSLGMGALITYGSYVGKDDSIVGAAALITVADISIAFLAGLMIFPLVFSQPSIEANAGPGLVFVALPGIFETMGGIGPFIGASFFLLLCFAALTSTVSLLEVPVAFVTDQFKTNRKKTVYLVATFIFFVGLPTMLSQGASDFFTNFIYYGGEDKDFFTLIENVFSDLALPLGGFFIAVFAGWSWKNKGFQKELYFGNAALEGTFLEKMILFMVRFISPFVVGAIFIISVLQIFFNISLF